MKLSKNEKLLLSVIRVLGGKDNKALFDHNAVCQLTGLGVVTVNKTLIALGVKDLIEYEDNKYVLVTKQGQANLLPKEQLIELHKKWKALGKETSVKKEAKKPEAKKVPAKKAPAKKKAVAKKATTKKAPVKKVLTKKAAAKKAPKKTAVKPPTVDTSTNKRAHRKDSICQNDVPVPSDGTKSRAVWDTLNKFKSKKRRAPTRKEAQEMNPDAGTSLVGVCLANWNRFNG